MKINMTKIDQLVKEGYIYQREHPEQKGLFIYNYSNKTQYESFWNEQTLMCRGLIVQREQQRPNQFMNDHTISGFSVIGKVIARPFEKFFNFEEFGRKNMSAFPPKGEKYYFSEKMDGSLGISYFIDGRPYISTRGSFESEQAIKGTEFLRKIMNNDSKIKLNKEYTYLFEIIYPKNQIIVNYGAKETLILLGIIDIETGENFLLDNSTKVNPGFDTTDIYSGYPYKQNFEEISNRNKNKKNREGVVVFWPEQNFRVKIKFENYKKIARFLSNVSDKNIWEAMKIGKPLSKDLEFIDNVPDEIFSELREKEEDFLVKFNSILTQCTEIFINKPEFDKNNRGKVAQYFNKYANGFNSVLFSMLDNKDYKKIIWGLIKSKGNDES